MTVLEWLERGDQILAEIEETKAEYERYFSAGTKTTAGNDGMPHGNDISNKVGNNAVEMAALLEEIKALEKRFDDYKQEVNAALKQLSVNQYKVLHKKYILKMSWDEIAIDMSYSRMQIWRFHNSGLKGLKSVIKIGKKP